MPSAGTRCTGAPSSTGPAGHPARTSADAQADSPVARQVACAQRATRSEKAFLLKKSGQEDSGDAFREADLEGSENAAQACAQTPGNVFASAPPALTAGGGQTCSCAQGA